MNDSEQEALSYIQKIQENTLSNGEYLAGIENDLDDINEHIASIDEYIIIANKEVSEDEQKSEEDIKQEEQKNETSGRREVQTEITIEDVHSEVVQINTTLKETNDLLTVGIFAQGIIIGVLVFTLFWNRFMR